MSSGLKDANAVVDLFPHEVAPGRKPSQKPGAQHDGHRQRLKEHFSNVGEALPDYVLLEMVLFNAIRRRDTKPIAKALLERFNGSFAEVVNAPPERLKEVNGVGDSVVHQLKLIRSAALRLVKTESVDKRPVFASWETVLAYCHAKMALEPKEQFFILFLDKRNRLIEEKIHQTGTVDHTPVYPREVVKRALELSASSIILIHNHPSGDTTPSKADIEMTRTIAEGAKALGIIVHDHLIVGRTGFTSMKSDKLF